MDINIGMQKILNCLLNTIFNILPSLWLAGGPSECWEGMPSMDTSGETAKEWGGRVTGVHNYLSIGVPDSINFGGGELGFVRSNITEAGEGTCEITKADNRTEGNAAEGRDLAMCGRKEGT